MNWKKEFDERFMFGNMNKSVLLLRDGNAYLMKLIKAFISTLLEKQEKKMIKRATNKKEEIIKEYQRDFPKEFYLWSELGFWLKGLPQCAQVALCARYVQVCHQAVFVRPLQCRRE